MKKFLFFLSIFLVFTLNSSIAGKPQKRESKKERIERLTKQTVDSISKKNPEVCFVKIPKLDVKDKVFVVNKSSIFIVQAAIALITDDGSVLPVGSAAGMAPGQTLEIASYDKNELKKFPQKYLVIKIKGTKRAAYSDNGFNTSDLKESDYTYEFNFNISDKSHDMYIEILNKAGTDFNF